MMRSIRLGIFLIVLGTALALMFVEVILRIADVGSLRSLRRGRDWMNTAHERYGWFHYPGREFTYGTQFTDFGNPVRINSKGLRDREYPYKKPEGVYRILILGDSFSASLEVPLEQTWHEVLETRLNGTGRTKVEVINAGVQGWATDQQLLYFRHEGIKYEPDLVILQFYVNDAWENDVDLERLMNDRMRKEKPYFVLGDDGQLELKQFPFREGAWLDTASSRTLAGQVKVFAQRNVRIYRLVRSVLRPQRPPRFVGPFCYTPPQMTAEEYVPLDLYVYAATLPPEHRGAWALTERLLEQVMTEVGARSVEFAVVYFPDRRQVVPEAWQEALKCWPLAAGLDWDLDKPNRLLGDFAGDRSVRYLDLTGPLRQYVASTRKMIYFPLDWHFNSEGHRLAARVIHEWLQRERLASAR